MTVDQFHPGFLSGNPVRDQPPLISRGIRAGRRLPTCISTGAKSVQGTVEFELTPLPLATLLRHMFGTIGTTGAGPYTHTASLGGIDDKSFTAQWGLPATGGTIHPFTMPGCKIQKWTIKATAGEIANLSLDVTAKDYVTATALATPSYAAVCPFTFVHGSVSVAGNVVGAVKSFEQTVTRPLRNEPFMGSTTVAKQVETGPAESMISVEAEFLDLTIHDLANTGVAVVLSFNNGLGATLTLTNNAWMVPGTPFIDGPDSLLSFTFEALSYGTTDAAGLTAVLVNTESSSA